MFFILLFLVSVFANNTEYENSRNQLAKISIFADAGKFPSLSFISKVTPTKFLVYAGIRTCNNLRQESFFIV